MSGDTLSQPSGVSLQCRYLVEHLMSTGKFRIIYLAAALKHPDHKPIKFKEFGDDFIMVPVDMYAPLNTLREVIDIEKPDAFWMMTDPRFYMHIFQNEAEIRKEVPILYNMIWDNADKETYPSYNKFYYKVCDFMGCINKSTYEMLGYFEGENFLSKAKYIPHGVPENDFKILETPSSELKEKHLGKKFKNSFVLFYNSRNALRKRTNNAILAFKRFLESEPLADAVMLLHCSPHDPEGSNLVTLVEHLKISERVIFSTGKIENGVMNELYNVADATIQLSSEEGFGLAILESLMCGTPVICSKTGGLQDQAIDPETGEHFGYCIEPAARTLIGSQATPWVWSDHINIDEAAFCIREIWDEFKIDGTHKERYAGQRARDSVLKRFHLPTIVKQWEDAIVETIETFKQKKESNQLRCVEI